MTSLLAIEGVGVGARGAVDALSAPSAAPTRPDAAAFDAALSGARAAAPQSIGAKFEAATLTTFLQTLLPSDGSQMWGGSSGAMWKGLYAENLAKSLSAAGGLGIAATIDRQTSAKAGGAE